MSQNIGEGNADNRERFKELKKLIGDQESRIQTLQTSAFQLANYYFVFQGVILAAISNTTSLKCSDAWFVFILSLLAAVLNFFALLSIGFKYVRAMDLHDQTWCEYNVLARMMSPRNRNRPDPLDFTGMHSPANNNVQGKNNDPVICRDRFPQVRRYAVLAVCMFLFLGFTAVTLSGPWLVICKHDHKHRKYNSFDNLDCLKLCDGSRCMMLCHDSY